MTGGKYFMAGVLALGLSACATPEQKAAEAEAERLAQQKLTIDLAAQCDAKTAELMRQQMQNPAFFTDSRLAKTAEEYHQKVSDPLFQSCYKLAWDNYLNQMRLQQVESWARQRRWDDDFNWMRRPLLCRGVHNGKPFVYRCG